MDQADENEQTVDDVLATLGRIHHYHKDRSKASMYSKIYDGQNPFEARKVNKELALFLRESSRMGRRKYTEQRQLMANLVTWPPYQDLSNLAKVIVPPMESFMQGVKISMPVALSSIVVRQLEVETTLPYNWLDKAQESGTSTMYKL